jgi:capsular polysaccharide biosynthesis protein
MSEPTEFSVGALRRKRAAAGSTGTEPAPAPEAGAPSSPQNRDDSPGGSPPGGSPPPSKSGGLPFDPLRVLDAVLRKLWIPLVAGAVLGGAGAGYGLWKFKSKYLATGQMMRQDLPNTFRTSDVGEPFKPHQLTAGTVLSLMKSLPLLERVARQSGGRITPRGLLSGVTLTPERNTDIIRVDFLTEQGPINAAALLNLYGRESVKLTQDLAGEEAAQVNRFLKSELAKTDQDIARTKEDMLAYQREAQLLDADKELDANLRQVADLDLKIETLRLDYETTDIRIAALEKELAQHNPIAAKLQGERDALTSLLQKYTDQNPLVIDQKGRITDLEQELSKQTNSEPAAPRSGEDGVAVSLYVDLFKLRSQKDVMRQQIEKMKVTKEMVQERMKSIPAKGLEYARFKVRLETLNTTRGLLSSRQREAQVFEDATIGYYRFFEVKAENVEKQGRGKKLIITSIGAGFFGAFVSMVVLGLRESLNPAIKTRADAIRATKLPLLAALPDLSAIPANEVRVWALHAWNRIATATPDVNGGSITLAFIGLKKGEGRSWLVERLAHAAADRRRCVVAVTNNPPGGVPTLTLEMALERPNEVLPAPGGIRWVWLPADWHWTAARREAWVKASAVWNTDPASVVVVEVAANDDAESLLFEELLPAVIWVTGSGMAAAPATGRRLDILRTGGVHLAGMILNREAKLLVGNAPPL